MNCHELDNLLFPYLDGEFSATERAELDQHLGGCAACSARVEVERRTHGSLRSAIQASSPRAPDALRGRVLQGLAKEDARASRAHYLPRFALAAGVLVASAASYQNYKVYRAHQYQEDAASRYSRNFPLEIQRATPEQLQSWFSGKLDHPVPVPSFPKTVTAGARLINVREIPAAMIRYDVGTKGAEVPHMGLFVYADARGDIDVPTLPEMMVTTSHGYNVISARDGDLVYTLVSDTTLGEVEELRMALQRRQAPPAGRASAPVVPSVVPVSLER